MQEVPVEGPIVLLKRSRMLCCASPTGEVVLRDPLTMRAENRVLAHAGAISDMDVSGNLLVTCGFSERCVAERGGF